MTNLNVSPYFWPVVRILPLDITWEVTDYEFLLTVIRKLNELIASNNALVEPYQSLVNDVQALQQEVDRIQAGDYAWLRQIIEKAIKNVWFGLTEAGNFVAYVPESWQDVTFGVTKWDTAVPTVPEFGHLVVKY